MSDLRTDKLIKALKIAKDILDFVSGDRYERECTKQERKEFYDLCDELIPSSSPPPEFQCTFCHKKFREESSLLQHIKVKHISIKELDFIVDQNGKLQTCTFIMKGKG